MTPLPPHLAPWAPYLSLFPEEIAQVLGPMIARLASLAGSLTLDRAQEGIPNGYDGIARKGPYDRLLTAEWLLQDELPDEFLRRAVSGEHLFLQRAYHETSAPKQTVALFDAGPGQLGAPRIAQLALLIVLAQRAARQGAHLQWGIFQDEATVSMESVTKGAVRALLEARRGSPVTPADIGRWMNLSSLSHASEIWFIGSESVAASARSHKAGALTISDVLEPGGPQRIRVTALSPKAGRAKEAILDIPPGRPAVQLLRDPFGTASGTWQAAPQPIDLRSNIIFSPDGRKLYVRGASGTLLTLWIPNSPNDPKGMSRPPAAFAPPAGHTIIAAGQTAGKKRTLVISQRGNELLLQELAKRGASANRAQLYTAARDADVLPDGGAFELDATWDFPFRPIGVLGARLCFIHADGSLIELANNKFEIAREGAIASRSTKDAFVYIRHRGNEPSVMAVRLDKAGKIDIAKVAAGLSREADDTCYYFAASGLANLVAYSKSASSYKTVHSPQTAHSPRPVSGGVPQGHTVIGMAECGSPKPELAVIAIDERRTRIDAHYPGRHETLLTASAPIVFAAASDAASVIAYFTETGALGVYSCTTRAMLLQAAGEATL
jgi:hypothetical protein